MALDFATESSIREVLKSAIAMHWLRPEVGLAIASFTIFGSALDSVPCEQSLDMACGDGTSTFFRAGGRFEFDFDVYRMGTVTNVTHQDISAENKDVFDHFDNSYAKPGIIKSPRHQITYGFDHKQNLLSKAAAIDFYKTVQLADLNAALPIEDESLDLCYCNSVYWGTDPEISIKEMWRLVKSGGHLILEVLTDEKINQSFLKRFPQFGPQWAKLLDRGRIDNNPGLRSQSGWESIFKKIGAHIEAVNDIFPIVLYKMYNVGLRPMFPVLNKMTAYIPAEQRRTLKSEMVDLFTDLLFPFLLHASEMSNDNGTKIRLQYILKK